MSQFSLDLPAEAKLSVESATASVKELINYYRIDVDAITDKKDRKTIEAAMTKMVGYYQRGLLENLRDSAILRVKQHLQNPPGSVKDLIYDRMSGKAKLATDGFDANDRYQRIYAMLDFLSGNVEGTISNLLGEDLSAAEDLGVLFLLG